MRTVLLAFMVVLLSGCGTPRVITSSEQAISVEIVNTGWTTGEMLRGGAAVADAHCGKFGKKANLENTTGFLGAPHVAHFSCR